MNTQRKEKKQAKENEAKRQKVESKKEVKEDPQSILEQIKESNSYKLLIKESFGGVMYNGNKLPDYQKTSQDIIELWDSLPSDFQQSQDGIVTGAMRFLSGK